MNALNYKGNVQLPGNSIECIHLVPYKEENARLWCFKFLHQQELVPLAETHV